MKYLWCILFVLLFPLSSLAGTVRLKWDCPECAAQGVTGFAVRYGHTTQLGVSQAGATSNPAPYEQILEIADAAARETVITVAPGDWYFRVTSVDAAGNESPLSTEAGVKVPVSAPSGVTVGVE